MSDQYKEARAVFCDIDSELYQRRISFGHMDAVDVFLSHMQRALNAYGEAVRRETVEECARLAEELKATGEETISAERRTFEVVGIAERIRALATDSEGRGE